METSQSRAILCLSKTNNVPNYFCITLKADSPSVETKVLTDCHIPLEPMQYKIEGDDQELRNRLASHIVDNFAIDGPDKIWEVIDLDS